VSGLTQVISSNNTLLVVLGKSGRLRSNPLEKFAAGVENCLFVEPVRIEHGGRSEALVDELLSEVLLGKRLSDPELGCAITHKNACASAIEVLNNQNEMKWALFVEDDADLDAEMFDKIQDELNTLDTEIATLVNYDSRNQNRTMPLQTRNPEKPLLFSRFWFAGAVCYAVNRKGLQYLQNFKDLPIDFVADWPVYYSRLKLFVSNQTWVYEVLGPSSIGVRHNQNIRKRFTMHIRQLGNLRKVSKLYDLPVRIVIRHLILTPLYRDVSGRLLAFRSDASKPMTNA